MFYSRRRNSGFGGFLLLLHILQIGFENIPPVTLLLVLLCSVIHFYPPFQLAFPLQLVCIKTLNIIYYRQYLRLLLAPFFHANDFHLYYNMT